VGGSPHKHVRLVLIGAGAAAARHISAIARYNDRARSDFFRVVAIMDASETIAALRASPEAARLKLSQCPVVPTLEDLLDTVDFDVAVLSSQGDKERVTSALLAKQKYVLLEPPLALSMEAALRLTKQSRQSQPSVQRVLVSEPIEYWPELHRASDLLSRDTVGSVFAAQGLGTSSGPEALSVLSEGIGCILAPGLSWIRALRRLLGPVEEVACMELVAAPSGAAE
ncbi:unnamed protein product, partial [Polarella glacialis]